MCVNGRRCDSEQGLWSLGAPLSPTNQMCLCILGHRALDLVNVHLFHDASNLIACNSSPSIYSANRKNALRYVINRLITSHACSVYCDWVGSHLFLTVVSPRRISDARHPPAPFFLFGDFNFRLDGLSLVQVTLISSGTQFLPGSLKPADPCLVFPEQHLSTSADVQTVRKDSSDEVERIICEEKDNDHQVSGSHPPIITRATPSMMRMMMMMMITAVVFIGRCCCTLRKSSLLTCIRRFSGRTTAEQ